jgi:quercetin dioxygenase-like cupin family protein
MDERLFDFWRSGPENAPKVTVPAIGLELALMLAPTVSHGAITVIETTNAAGFGPPVHRHRETEIFRVLEGRYLFEVDGQSFHASEGELVSVPGGAVHGFVNVTKKPARQLVMILPGMDAMNFFIGLGRIMAGGAPEKSVLDSFGAQWGVEFLGPPLFPE